MPSLQERVGELFISGFPGETPPAEILRQIEEHSLGGIVLFAENCADHDNLRRSIELLQARAEKPLFMAIDQEGGRVCRLSGKPAEYDSAEAYGANAGQSASALQAALAHYQADFQSAAKYLSEIGINLLLGPVCDLRPDAKTPDTATALSGRTFSGNPDIVSAFVQTAVRIAHENHLLSCLKHAPGLGSIKVDPHVTLGATRHSATEFFERDLRPFRAGCASGADLVMTSHFLIPELDTAPVTLSKTIIESVIRNVIPAKTALITDDLDMGALRDFGGVGVVCVKALNAGHDLLLARSNDTIVQGRTALQQGLEDGAVDKYRFTEALDRVERLRGALETVS